MKYGRIGLISAFFGVLFAGGAAAQSQFVRDWHGFYVGGGIGNLDVEGTGQSFSNATGLPLGPRGSSKSQSLLYHARLSYNWMLSPTFLFGLQGGLALVDTSTSNVVGATTISFKDTWTGSVRARVGFVVSNTIFYGAAGGIVRYQDVSRTAPGIIDDVTSKGHGWTAGLGVEHAIDERWSVFLEARRNWIDTRTNFANAGFRSEGSATSDVVALGVNFKIW